MSSTDLVNFRDQFLAKTEARLNALDIAAASDTDLLLNSALLKAYAAVNDFDVISVNALSFLSNKTGAQLETALQDPSNRARFEEITASNAAMSAIWASDSATDAVVASTTARLSVYNSDIALAALQATPTQVQRLITRGAASNVVSGSYANAPYVIVANGTKLILLRRFYTNASQADVLDWARGSTTAAVGQGPTGGGRNLDTGIAAVGCVSGGYAPSGSPTSDATVSNFVSAANGLQIRVAPGTGNTQVKYILV